MDDVEKRVKETIEQMPDHEKYGFGDAGVLTDEAQKKAYKLEKEAREQEANKDEEK